MNPLQGDRPGKVYLVGAGPGDPRLITLRGVECLARADLLLYDCMVNPVLLDHAPPCTDAIALNRGNSKDPGRALSQKQINARLIDAAREGKTVVYLKGGDPGVFAHTAVEIEALAAADIRYEIVPGVTAALAAAGYAAIPITHGQHASAVALVTGQEQGGKPGPPLDYGTLADFPGTLIFYIGLAAAEQWSRALLHRGKPPETPVAIVQRCSWADQETIRCTLATLCDVIARQEILSPTVIVVGEVVSLAPEVSWFTARKLFGKRVLLTRPRAQAAELAERLLELGADVMFQPAIQIRAPADWAPVDAVLARLEQYDWLVFSSVNGVRYLLDRLCGSGRDLRRLGHLKLAAIGPATAEELRRYHLQADLVPREYRAETLAEALIRRAGHGGPAGARGSRFLLARASRGRDLLAERLRAAGGAVDQVVVYSSIDVPTPQPDVAAAISAGRIDWVTVTSSAIARSLVALFGETLRKSDLVSISPITSEVLRGLGHEPAAEAAEYSMNGLVDAILAHHEA